MKKCTKDTSVSCLAKNNSIKDTFVSCFTKNDISHFPVKEDIAFRMHFDRLPKQINYLAK